MRRHVWLDRDNEGEYILYNSCLCMSSSDRIHGSSDSIYAVIQAPNVVHRSFSSDDIETHEWNRDVRQAYI